MRQIARGVYAPEIPKTPEYKDSRASGYVSIYTAQRWENWSLALKQAELTYKDEAAKAEAKRKLISEAVDDLDKEIGALERATRSLQEGTIKANEAANARTVAAKNSADRYNAGELGRNARSNAMLQAGAAGVRTGSSPTERILKTRKDEIDAYLNDKQIGISLDFRNGESAGKTWADVTGKVRAGYGNKAGLSPDEILAATFEQANAEGKADLLMSHLSDADMDAIERGQASLKKTTTTVTGGSGTATVDASGFMTDPSLVGGVVATRIDGEGRDAQLAAYQTQLDALKAKRQQELLSLGLINEPNPDLIGSARGIYADKFGGTPQYNRSQNLDKVKRLLDTFIEDELSKLPAGSGIEAQKTARGLGVTKALEAMKGRTYKEPVAPVTPAPEPVEDPVPFMSGFLSDTGDWNYTFLPNGGPNKEPAFQVFVGDKLMGTYTADTAQYRSLDKQTKEMKARGQKLTLDDGGYEWVWDPKLNSYVTINDPAQPGRIIAYGNNTTVGDDLSTRSKVQRNLYFQAQAKEKAKSAAPTPTPDVTFKDPADTYEIPEREEIDYSKVPIREVREETVIRSDKAEGAALGKIPAPKKTAHEIDKDKRNQSILDAFKLHNQPKRVDRLVNTTTYGETVKALVDANPSLEDKALTPMQLQQKVIEEFNEDYDTQKKALELLNALLILDDKKNLIK